MEKAVCQIHEFTKFKFTQKIGGWSKFNLKRPASAYILFTKAVRVQLKGKYANGKVPMEAVATEASAKWAKMSDKEKAPYTNEAAALRKTAIEELKVEKSKFKKARLEIAMELPHGWTRVYHGKDDSDKSYFINNDLGVLVFTKPYEMEEGLKRVARKTTKGKGKAAK